MNDIQKRMIEERLSALADLFAQIGPEFDLEATDSDGGVWRFQVELESEE